MNNRKKYDKNYSSLKVVNGLLILLTLIIVSCNKDEDIIDFPDEYTVGSNDSEVGVEDNKIKYGNIKLQSDAAGAMVPDYCARKDKRKVRPIGAHLE